MSVSGYHGGKWLPWWLVVTMVVTGYHGGYQGG